jgi:hypothetical protein
MYLVKIQTHAFPEITDNPAAGSRRCTGRLAAANSA